MSSAAKLRKYGRGTATVAAAALVMTSFGPAAFASWDDAPQTNMIEGLQSAGTIGIVDTSLSLDGDATADSLVPAGNLTATPSTVVDSVGADNKRDENQGATLVYAGEKGQEIADVQLVLPNRFASGDILDLRLLDRSATEHGDGLANKSAETLVGFSGTEGVTVEVSKQAYAAGTNISSDTDAKQQTSGGTPTGNVATGDFLPWKANAVTSTAPLAGTAPGAGPELGAPQLTEDNSVQGKNNLRLRVNNKSAGDPDGVWVVTIKGLKVDLGAKATPGELRIVPFLSNVKPAGDGYTASPWFKGNSKEDNAGTPTDPGDDTPREIGIYTVPAYVSPVKVSSTKNDIVADGLPQAIGEITISETQPFSLHRTGAATYTIDFSDSGADVEIANANVANEVKVTTTGGPAAETISNVTLDNTKQKLSFTLNGSDDATISTIKIAGLVLKATKSGEINYRVTGGAISGSSTDRQVWMPTPAGSSELSIPAYGIHPDAALLWWNRVTNSPGYGTDLTVAETQPTRTTAPQYSVAMDATTVNRRAATATAVTVTADPASDLLPAGEYTVSGSGASWTLAGPSGFTATSTAVNGTYTVVAAGPTGAASGDKYTLANAAAGDKFTIPAANFVLSGAGGSSATGYTAGTGDPALPYGTYTFGAGTGTNVDGDETLTLGVAGVVFARSAANSNIFSVTNANSVPGFTVGDTYTFNGSVLGNLTVAAPTTTGNTELVAALSITNGSNSDDSSGSTNLPDGQYTVSADGNTITGMGTTLQRVGATEVFRVESSDNPALVHDRYTIAGATANTVFSTTGGAADRIIGQPSGLSFGGGTLAAGSYYVTQGADSTHFDIRTAPGGAGTLVFDEIVNLTPKAPEGPAVPSIAQNVNYTFTGLQAGTVITVAAAQTLNVSDYGVNQKDIVAPLRDFTQLGTASSESARIGGNNRYETAAKIAERWAMGDKSNVHGKVRNAIIASGENFPDALSASYLSQRMGAPILLTQRGSLPADTIEALRDRQVDKVFIVGGAAAVSKDVEAKLADLNTYRWSGTRGTDSDPNYGGLETTGAKLQVQRISSANPQNDTRYTTNQLVNMYAAAWGGNRTIGKTIYKSGEAGKYTAIFARGDNFPDALAAGVLTAGMNDGVLNPINIGTDQALPLILTAPDSLSDSAKAQIDRLDVQHGLIIGSENAVSDGVKKSMEDAGLSNTRIGGADRYFTAAAVAEFAMRSDTASASNEFPGLGFINYDSDNKATSDTNAWLANGLKFPDALTAAPWLGRNAQVLNLTMGTNDLSDGTKDFLSKRAADVDRVNALGLGDAVASKVLTEANSIASSK